MVARFRDCRLPSASVVGFRRLPSSASVSFLRRLLFSSAPVLVGFRHVRFRLLLATPVVVGGGSCHRRCRHHQQILLFMGQNSNVYGTKDHFFFVHPINCFFYQLVQNESPRCFTNALFLFHRQLNCILKELSVFF